MSPDPTSLAVSPVDGGYVVKRQPGRVHGSFAEAGAEASRLSAIHPAPPFMVLKIVGVALTEAEAA